MKFANNILKFKLFAYADSQDEIYTNKHILLLLFLELIIFARKNFFKAQKKIIVN